MRVLIVEDDPTARLMLKSMLIKIADVTESTTGNEGLQAFYSALKAGNHFDLICLDIGLPEIDGTDVLRLIRKAEAEKCAKKAVVLILSASSESESVQNMLALGADGYLVKPVDRAKLIARLRSLGVELSAPQDPPKTLVHEFTALCARDAVPLPLLQPLLERIQESIKRQTNRDAKPAPSPGPAAANPGSTPEGPAQPTQTQPEALQEAAPQPAQ